MTEQPKEPEKRQIQVQPELWAVELDVDGKRTELEVSFVRHEAKVGLREHASGLAVAKAQQAGAEAVEAIDCHFVAYGDPVTIEIPAEPKLPRKPLRPTDEIIAERYGEFRQIPRGSVVMAKGKAWKVDKWWTPGHVKYHPPKPYPFPGDMVELCAGVLGQERITVPFEEMEPTGELLNQPSELDT